MASLDDAEVLWRRVDPKRFVEPDGKVQSAAFKTEEFCVHRAALTTIDAVLKDFPEHHIYEFTVADAKAAGATDVDDDRLPEEPEDHAMIRGETKKKQFATKLRDRARRVYPPK